MAETDPPPGFRSTVHQGPLRPVLIWFAPYELMLPNVLVGMYLCLMLTWRFVLLTALIHGLLALLWWIDPHFLYALIEARKFQRPLGVD